MPANPTPPRPVSETPKCSHLHIDDYRDAASADGDGVYHDSEHCADCGQWLTRLTRERPSHERMMMLPALSRPQGPDLRPVHWRRWAVLSPEGEPRRFCLTEGDADETACGDEDVQEVAVYPVDAAGPQGRGEVSAEESPITDAERIDAIATTVGATTDGVTIHDATPDWSVVVLNDGEVCGRGEDVRTALDQLVRQDRLVAKVLTDQRSALAGQCGPEACSVCAGSGKPVSGKPCICGGVGTEQAELQGFRARCYELEQENVALRDGQRREKPAKYDQAPNGCWAACLAGLTGIAHQELAALVPSEQVSDGSRQKFDVNYHNAMIAKLKEFGWTVAYMGSRVPRGFAIGCGPSPRGVEHAVIVHDGTLWHDPHPSRAGCEIREYEIVVPLAALPTTPSSGADKK